MGPHYNTWPNSAFTPFRGEKNTNRLLARTRHGALAWQNQSRYHIQRNYAPHDWLPTLTAAVVDAYIKDKLLKHPKPITAPTKTTWTVITFCLCSQAKRTKATAAKFSISFSGPHLFWRRQYCTERQRISFQDISHVLAAAGKTLAEGQRENTQGKLCAVVRQRTPTLLAAEFCCQCCLINYFIQFFNI